MLEKYTYINPTRKLYIFMGQGIKVVSRDYFAVVQNSLEVHRLHALQQQVFPMEPFLTTTPSLFSFFLRSFLLSSEDKKLLRNLQHRTEKGPNRENWH